MNVDIQPRYNKITAKCACGNSFEIGSVLTEDLQLEVCNACHPFYTGQQKKIGHAGKVDDFNRRFGIKKEDKK